MTEHAARPDDVLVRGVYRNVSTALMRRTNYEGFHGYSPPFARDPETSPRGRDLAIWLDEVEKVVFSRTLTEAKWSDARIAQQEAAEKIAALKRQEGRDIMVVNSASIVHALPRPTWSTGLRLMMVPLVWGGGLHIFPDGIPGRSGTSRRRRTSPAARSASRTCAGADAPARTAACPRHSAGGQPRSPGGWPASAPRPR